MKLLKFVEAINLLAWKLSPKVPFTGLNIISKEIRKLSTKETAILDLGCGKGEAIKLLFGKDKLNYKICGVEIFRPYILEAKQKGIYTDLILADVRNLPFKSKSFDVLLLLEVIEHLTKEKGAKLLKEMERIARKGIIVRTPKGFLRKEKIEDSNPFQEHISSWEPKELRNLGYKVKGNRIPHLKKLPQPLATLLELTLSVLAGPLFCLFPSLAGDFVAIKRLKFSSAKGNNDRNREG
ncbi:class I SAM-dependent methyltransferase, partial [Dehalococcoidales bacterium]|nr:class I SAM-dependent methyltransferase [Dehalococcoidales bacterium]